MPSILVNAPDLGINKLLPQNMRDPREAGNLTQNFIYENGILHTPDGFAKLDMTTGLNSGANVLAIFPYREADEYDHLIAVSTTKIYDHNYVSNSWDDKTGTATTSTLSYPISYATVLHNDTDIYLDEDTARAHAYWHLVVCDGGQSNMQRWTGRYETDFADLLGGGGYHSGTTHRGLQIGVFRSRMIILSPRTYSGGVWSENNQRVQYPVVSKLQTWTGTGSGFYDLMDTGGTNVWAAPLGNSQYIVYQTNGIWSLNYIGGTDVFSPLPVIPDLGLLSYNLLANFNNVHYFVGTDYNVYAYYGGTVKKSIGDKIQDELQESIDDAYLPRCKMAIGPFGRRLWIFIVPSGSSFCTKAYGYDLRTGAWMVEDFGSRYTTSGITAANLVGSQSYITGDTYATAVAAGTTYATAVTAGTTYAQAQSITRASPRLVVGDSDGLVQQFAPGTTAYDGELISSRHQTPVFDLGAPDKWKRWPGISVTACGTGTNKAMYVRYRTSNFDTSDTGWTDQTQTIGSDFEEYPFYINKSSKRIQYEFMDFSGFPLKIRSYELMEPFVEDDR